MLSRKALTCVASGGEKPSKYNKIAETRKTFEKRRLVAMKENFNKLVMIATAETKELGDFLKDLDAVHKSELMPKEEKQSDSENVFKDP